MHRLLALLFLLTPLQALATDLSSPIGVWHTVDDRTGAERSDVRIFQSGDKVDGQVVHISDPKEAVLLCRKCTDDRRDQPVLGMVILRGMTRDGAEWTGGRIVDPETGDVYRCSMRLGPDGRTLILRGYVMVPMFGRSQTWLRAADAP